MGNSDVEDSLRRLDRLTQEEARMASAEQLKVTHTIKERLTDVDKRVKGIDDTVNSVEVEVQNAHSDVQDVGSKVKGVEGEIQASRRGVQDLGSKLQSIGGNVKDNSGRLRDFGDKIYQFDRSLPFLNHAQDCEGLNSFTGSLLREDLLRWLSAPNPSDNHNIARNACYRDTARWFIQGSIFKQWKSAGSLLWIHGKRALLLAFTVRWHLITF